MTLEEALDVVRLRLARSLVKIVGLDPSGALLIAVHPDPRGKVFRVRSLEPFERSELADFLEALVICLRHKWGVVE